MATQESQTIGGGSHAADEQATVVNKRFDPGVQAFERHADNRSQDDVSNIPDHPHEDAFQQGTNMNANEPGGPDANGSLDSRPDAHNPEDVSDVESGVVEEEDNCSAGGDSDDTDGDDDDADGDDDDVDGDDDDSDGDDDDVDGDDDDVDGDGNSSEPGTEGPASNDDPDVTRREDLETLLRKLKRYADLYNLDEQYPTWANLLRQQMPGSTTAVSASRNLIEYRPFHNAPVYGLNKNAIRFMIRFEATNKRPCFFPNRFLGDTFKWRSMARESDTIQKNADDDMYIQMVGGHKIFLSTTEAKIVNMNNTDRKNLSPAQQTTWHTLAEKFIPLYLPDTIRQVIQEKIPHVNPRASISHGQVYERFKSLYKNANPDAFRTNAFLPTIILFCTELGRIRPTIADSLKTKQCEHFLAEEIIFQRFEDKHQIMDIHGNRSNIVQIRFSSQYFTDRNKSKGSGKGTKGSGKETTKGRPAKDSTVAALQKELTKKTTRGRPAKSPTVAALQKDLTKTVAELNAAKTDKAELERRLDIESNRKKDAQSRCDQSDLKLRTEIEQRTRLSLDLSRSNTQCKDLQENLRVVRSEGDRLREVIRKDTELVRSSKQKELSFDKIQTQTQEEIASLKKDKSNIQTLLDQATDKLSKIHSQEETTKSRYDGELANLKCQMQILESQISAKSLEVKSYKNKAADDRANIEHKDFQILHLSKIGLDTQMQVDSQKNSRILQQNSRITKLKKKVNLLNTTMIAGAIVAAGSIMAMSKVQTIQILVENGISNSAAEGVIGKLAGQCAAEIVRNSIG